MDIALINPFLAYLDSLGFWVWWIAAVALVIFEVLAPGAIFLWLGISATAMGGLVFFLPTMDWKLQLAIFAVLSVASIAILRRRFKPQTAKTDQPHLNQRGQGMIGKELVLSSAIENGQGRAYVGDSGWLVEGPDLPAGARVRVSGVTGSSLQVVEIKD
jgi:membrane protein implicated in regulation of membrane protease activity